MVWSQNQPGYPTIFDPGNCSLISQVLPANTKKFLKDFMDGNAFRNPISQVTGLLQGQLGDSMSKLNNLAGISSGFGQDLTRLNGALSSINGELGAFINHTNRLSGIQVDGDAGILPRLDEIIGVVSAYNSIQDLLKDPGDLLEDNFSNAFSSLNPQIVGPFFDNFGDNMIKISSLLGNIENQLAMGGATDLAATVGQLRQLTDNIRSLESNMKQIMDNDNNHFAMALAFVERYALGNTIISTSLTDPCFGAKLVKNLITQPDFSKGLDDIAEENGAKIEGSPINLLDHIPSLKGLEQPPTEARAPGVIA